MTSVVLLHIPVVLHSNVQHAKMVCCSAKVVGTLLLMLSVFCILLANQEANEYYTNVSVRWCTAG